jgi:hypothetical protein
MSRFDEDSAALIAKKLMQAHIWASDPRASGIASLFNFKHANDDRNFFTAIVPMWVEMGLTK